MPGGRRPKGVARIEALEGSEGAKARLKAALETMMGKKTMAEASEEVGLREAMLYVERAQALQGALEALEPKPLGRPRKLEEVDPGELERLREENAALREKLRKLEVKVDFQAALSSVQEKEKVAEKKTQASREKR